MALDQGDIEAAFLSRLLTLTPPWETKRPGATFNPTATQSWQRATLLPGDPMPVAFGVGVYSRLFGLYQVDLFTPRREADARALYNRANAVLRLFWPDDNRGMTLAAGAGEVVIEKRPSVSALIETSATHNQMFVSIPFRADDAPAAA